MNFYKADELKQLECRADWKISTRSLACIMKMFFVYGF